MGTSEFDSARNIPFAKTLQINRGLSLAHQLKSCPCNLQWRFATKNHYHWCTWQMRNRSFRFNHSNPKHHPYKMGSSRNAQSRSVRIHFDTINLHQLHLLDAENPSIHNQRNVQVNCCIERDLRCQLRFHQPKQSSPVLWIDHI